MCLPDGAHLHEQDFTYLLLDMQMEKKKDKDKKKDKKDKGKIDKGTQTEVNTALSLNMS